MTLSLNEVESLARKAARGAGYSFGLAEDAGKATRWLCAAGLPGGEALACLLQLNDNAPYDACRPATSTNPWRARSGQLCPLITGAAICDRAATLADGGTIALGPTAHPLLLLPFVAAASDMTGACLGITWPGLRMTRADRKTHLKAAVDALRLAHVDTLKIAHVTETPGDRIRRAYRAELTPDCAAVLGQLAHRTYAPDTPESRLSGAGAGLSDND